MDSFSELVRITRGGGGKLAGRKVASVKTGQEGVEPIVILDSDDEVDLTNEEAEKPAEPEEEEKARKEPAESIAQQEPNEGIVQKELDESVAQKSASSEAKAGAQDIAQDVGGTVDDEKFGKVNERVAGRVAETEATVSTDEELNEEPGDAMSWHPDVPKLQEKDEQDDKSNEQVAPSVAFDKENEVAEIEKGPVETKESKMAEIEEVPADIKETEVAEIEEVPPEIKETEVAGIEEVPAETEESEVTEIEKGHIESNESEVAEIEIVPVEMKEGEVTEIEKVPAETPVSIKVEEEEEEEAKCGKFEGLDKRKERLQSAETEVEEVLAVQAAEEEANQVQVKQEEMEIEETSYVQTEAAVTGERF